MQCAHAHVHAGERRASSAETPPRPGKGKPRRLPSLVVGKSSQTGRGEGEGKGEREEEEAPASVASPDPFEETSASEALLLSPL